MANADIGLIGLAVMGENLVLNMANHGFTVAVYNRTSDKVDAFVNGRGAGKSVVGCHTLEQLCQSLKRPRKVMMMVRAGDAVDSLIDQLLPYLEPGDIVIDGGNSHYPDSNRRTEALADKGILFVGAGISGGEEGALNGPSIMPGGASDAWPSLQPIFQNIAAKVEDGTPCCDWVGDAGSGHFVKMVHNGIEYGDMQLICEAYQLLKEVGGLSNDELAQVFADWDKGELNSFLIEITSEIFKKKDEETGKHVVDLILDAAGQKGTGKWTVNVALDLAKPVTLIGEAVFARCLSAEKQERTAASKILKGPKPSFDGDRAAFVNHVRDALYAAKLVSYAQGFVLMRAAAQEFKWRLNYGAIALMWRGGCIIRSKFLGKIKDAFDQNSELSNLLLDPWFTETLQRTQGGWREVVSKAALLGIPVPAISSALAYFDGYRTERLPANLLQAQRDFFGAHTYERLDKPRGEFFHTNWTGRGGTTASTSYVA
ncbi:MAG: decarboxylating NADP(+)-dependent phosphogluconate dehydrogenase [Bdellovibrionales bacterium]|nr:decarboxylating NADP(+)-dependent phosphogluconate dehydrogenase [Bdellovibrionales bacterium]